MLREIWKKLGGSTLCGAALLTVANLASAQLGPPSVPPGLPPTPTNVAPSGADDMKARMDRLEKQNQDLLNMVKTLQMQAAGRPVLAAPVAAEGGAGGNLNKNDVQKIVGEYLSTREAQNQAAKADQAAQGFAVGKNLGMSVFWKNGLYAQTEDKAFYVHVGGRTQMDYVGYTGSDDVQFGKGGVGRLKDGVNFRRARLEVDGTLFEVVDFFAEYEFLGNTFNTDPTTPASPTNVVNTPGPTDLWATLTHIPWIGNIRVGSMKPPIGLEHLTSSRWLDFMERSFAFDTYLGGTNNGFLPGIQAFNWTEDERFTWQLGLFKNNQTVLGWNVGSGEMDMSGRVTWLPVYQDNGRYLVHLGLGASHRDLDDDKARLRARTLLRNGPFTLQTILADVTVSGNTQTLVVPEFALIAGPFMLQAEYFGSWVTNTTLPAFTGKNFGTTYTQSAYVQASYFLTGENRPWNKKGWSGSAPDRVVPFRNYYGVAGQDGSRLFSSGAWQIAARYSWMDLNTQAQQTGMLNDVTLGLNWFLNPNMKFQWNYDYVFRNAAGTTSDGPIHGFGFRFAMDF